MEVQEMAPVPSMQEKRRQKVKPLGIYGPIIIGCVLLLYVFTMGEIWNNHSVQSYLVLCTGIMSINVGLLALALTAHNK